MNWEDRYFARDFDTTKIIPSHVMRELSRVVLKVPSFVTQHDHYWALLRTNKPQHRALVYWLVKNIYYDNKRNGMIEHFGQLLDAPYVLHSFVCNATTHDKPYTGNDQCQIQENNIFFHAGAIVNKALEYDLDTCIIGCREGIDQRPINELRTEYFELLSKCFPNFPDLDAEEDEVFPNLSIGLGYGIKHENKFQIQRHGFKWVSYKSNHKKPNLLK
jgi:hypothetical protein